MVISGLWNSVWGYVGQAKLNGFGKEHLEPAVVKSGGSKSFIDKEQRVTWDATFGDAVNDKVKVFFLNS